MEYKLKSQIVSHLRTVVKRCQTQEVSQEVRLSDGMPDIGRILGAWGQPVIRSKDWHGDSMSVSAGIMAWVMYLPEDGGEPRSVETWIPCQFRWDFPQTQRDGSICVNTAMRSVDARSTSARKMIVRACISADGSAYEPVETSTYTDENLPSDMELLREEYPMQVRKEAGEKHFTMDSDIPLPQNAQKIVHCSACPEITEAKVLGGKLVFRGKCEMKAQVLCEDGDLIPCAWECSFSQIAELDSVYSDDTEISILPVLTNMELEYSSGEEPSAAHLGIAAQYVIWEKNRISCILDAYSPYRTVEPKWETVQIPALLDTREKKLSFEQTVEGSFSQVLEADLTCDAPRWQTISDGTAITISAAVQVIYRDGANCLQSICHRMELTEPMPGDAGEVSLWLTDAPSVTTMLAGGDLKISGCIKVCVESVSDTKIEMVSALDFDEKRSKPQECPTLVLRRAENSSLWELAKQYGSTVEAITKANGLSTAPSQQDLLLIPIA